MGEHHVSPVNTKQYIRISINEPGLNNRISVNTAQEC